MRPSDETLIAYLDGELDATEFDEVESALQDSPALRQRLQRLAESDERVRRSYQAALEAPVPPELIAAILNAPDPRLDDRARASLQTAQPGLGARLRHWVERLLDQRGPLAFASVLALVAGGWVAWSLKPAAEPAAWTLVSGETIQDPGLRVALETAPSGRVLRAGGHQLELLASFEHKDQHFCREFNTSTQGAQALDHLGIACREADGEWRLALLVSEQGPTDPAQDGYRTASDRQHEAADSYLRANTSGEPIDPVRERQLIDRTWAP